MRIDLRIVATRRPELLARTLESFFGLGLKEFEIVDVVMNLDPAFGDEAAAADCRSLLARHRPDAAVLEPETPSFGAAVKRLWSGDGARPFFHLEDDWEAVEPLPAAAVRDAFAQGHCAVTPLSEEHRWDGRDKACIHWERRRVLGMNMGKRRTGVHQFGTSPRFLQPDIARRLAARMRTDLDPEKQMALEPLFSMVNDLTSVYVTTARGRPIIRDIGRTWRDERRIRKVVRDHRSTWVTEGADHEEG